ncbi:MAG: hypothetical protein HQK63_10605 [Desulfamplus sp.]|nr:hypothetical protein [Desulfamplus sp.]
MRAILGALASRARDYLNDSFPLNEMQNIIELWGADVSLSEILSQWCKNSDKQIVLFIDEIDSLIGDTLISVLRQIRAGYDKRPENFPQSIILCGVRDVRDYRIHSARDKAIITGGSSFNIKAVSLRLGNFTEPDVYELLEEHTKETSQPWLVNELAYQACFETKAKRDKILQRVPITEEMV